jgi:SepF-like predicted cell division protein (DUF552 family)
MRNLIDVGNVVMADDSGFEEGINSERQLVLQCCHQSDKYNKGQITYRREIVVSTPGGIVVTYRKSTC